MQLNIDDGVIAEAINHAMHDTINTALEHNLWRAIQKLIEEKEPIFLDAVKKYMKSKEYTILLEKAIKEAANHRIEEMVQTFVEYESDEIVGEVLKKFLEKKLKV